MWLNDNPKIEPCWEQLYGSDVHLTGMFGASFFAIKQDLEMSRFSNRDTHWLLSNLFQTNMRVVQQTVFAKFCLEDTLTFRGDELKTLLLEPVIKPTVEKLHLLKAKEIKIVLADTLKHVLEKSAKLLRYAKIERIQVDSKSSEQLDKCVIHALIQRAREVVLTSAAAAVAVQSFPFQLSDQECQDFIVSRLHEQQPTFLTRASREFIFKEAVCRVRTFQSFRFPGNITNFTFNGFSASHEFELDSIELESHTAYARRLYQFCKDVKRYTFDLRLCQEDTVPCMVKGKRFKAILLEGEIDAESVRL